MGNFEVDRLNARSEKGFRLGCKNRRRPGAIINYDSRAILTVLRSHALCHFVCCPFLVINPYSSSSNTVASIIIRLPAPHFKLEDFPFRL